MWTHGVLNNQVFTEHLVCAGPCSRHQDPAENNPQLGCRLSFPTPPPYGPKDGHKHDLSTALGPAGGPGCLPLALGTHPEDIGQDERIRQSLGEHSSLQLTSKPCLFFPSRFFTCLTPVTPEPASVECYCPPRSMRGFRCLSREGGVRARRGTVPGLKHLPPFSRYALAQALALLQECYVLAFPCSFLGVVWRRGWRIYWHPMADGGGSGGEMLRRKGAEGGLAQHMSPVLPTWSHHTWHKAEP